MAKQIWTFYVSQEPTVTCDVLVTGEHGAERTIKVTLRNRSATPILDPLTVQILQGDEVVETLEDQAPVPISALAKTEKEYNYTPSIDGWKIKVTYGED